MKQIFIMRKDLGMKSGKLATQVAHASSMIIKDICLEGTEKDKEDMELWINDFDYRKIVLKTDSEESVLHYEKICKENNLNYFLVIDNGYTVFNGEKTITGIGIGPHDNEVVDRLFSELKLY